MLEKASTGLSPGLASRWRRFGLDSPHLNALREDAGLAPALKKKKGNESANKWTNMSQGVRAGPGSSEDRINPPSPRNLRLNVDLTAAKLFLHTRDPKLRRARTCCCCFHGNRDHLSSLESVFRSDSKKIRNLLKMDILSTIFNLK